MGKPKPTEGAIDAAARLVAKALDEHGVLLEHDAALPSATALIAGCPIEGSWWGHARGALIYEALTAIEDEVVMAKLIKGKETLVHRRLWPALVSVGMSREGWQLAGLSDDAARVLKRSDEGKQLRADELSDFGSTKVVRELFRELELRLLVNSRSVHTERGHHVRVLSSWKAFRTEHGVKASSLPESGQAREQFVEAVTSWGISRSRVFPWDPRPSRR